jgi:hypothetical protein
MPQEKKEESTEIFVARQPIFDIRRNVYAYQLLFSKGFHDYASHVDIDYAALKVISNSLIIGLNRENLGEHIDRSPRSERFRGQSRMSLR